MPRAFNIVDHLAGSTIQKHSRSEGRACSMFVRILSVQVHESQVLPVTGNGVAQVDRHWHGRLGIPLRQLRFVGCRPQKRAVLGAMMTCVIIHALRAQ